MAQPPPQIVSLPDSFLTGLDNYPHVPHPGGIPTASGSSTQNTDPPRYALAVDVGVHLQEAAQVLASIPHNSPFRFEVLDDAEICTFHSNEADVVRSTALYLLHPVNQALMNSPLTANTFRCQSETTNQGTRSDITYFKTPPPNQHGATHRRPFFVLEFKRRGTLQPNLFGRAVMPRQAFDVRASREAWIARYAVSNRADQPDQTAFPPGILAPMKQVTAYALAHRTRFVSLFDWDTLVLVEFPQAGFQPPDDCGEYCSLTVVTESRRMRRALLGFMHRAWRYT